MQRYNEKPWSAIRNSIGNLPRELTLNGVTKTPTLLYWGHYVHAAGCKAVGGYGPNLAVAGGLGDIVPRTATLIDETAARFAGTGGAGLTGDRLASASATAGNIATNDAVWELVFSSSIAAMACIIQKQHSATGVGWGVYWNTNNLRLMLHDGSNSAGHNSNTVSASVMHHALAFVNRDVTGENGRGWYVDSAVTTGDSTDMSIVTGSVDVTDCLMIGGTDCAYYDWGGDLLYAAMWNGANWLGAGAAGKAEVAAVAAARAALIPYTAMQA